MRDNRSNRRGGFRGRSEGRGNFRGRSSSKRFEGDYEERGGFDDRGGRRFEKRSVAMHDVVCATCGKDCQVPFKPTMDKPVFCSDCFKKPEGPRDRSSISGVSPEQFKQLNAKLDKILEILEAVTTEEVEDEESEEDEK